MAIFTTKIGISFLIAVASLLLLSGCGRYVETEEEVGWKGLAKIDRFLAASRMLREMGVESASYAGLPKLPPPPGTTLCIPAGSLQNKGTLSELDDWIRYDGGNMVCFLDLDDEVKYQEDEEKYSFQKFLDHFDLEIDLAEKTKPSHVPALAFADFPDLKDSYDTDFKSPFNFRYTAGNDDDPPFYFCQTFTLGEGNVFVWSTAAPFTNKSLEKKQHATLLWDVINRFEPESVWFVYSSKLSFWRLLWESGPYALCALGVLLVAWLWSYAKRFGPIFATVDNLTNRLDDHLTASGYFYAKHKADHLILDRAKQSLSVGLARKTNLPIDSDITDILSACEQQEILSKAQLDLFRNPYPESKTEQLQFLQQLQALKKVL